MDGGAWKAAVHEVAEGRTRLSDFSFTFHFHALEKEMATPLQYSCLENPRDRGAWWAAVSGVAQSHTRLTRLSSSSSSVSMLVPISHFTSPSPFPLGVLKFALYICLDFCFANKSICITFSGFPDSSVGNESTCNVGDSSLILGQEDLLEKG